MIIPSKRFVLFIILIFYYGCIAPRLEFISFGETDYEKLDIDQVVIYEDRLKIDSNFEEIGVIILNQKYQSKLLPQIKLEASKHGANGIIIEGDNAVLLRILSKNIEEKNNEKAI